MEQGETLFRNANQSRKEDPVAKPIMPEGKPMEASTIVRRARKKRHILSPPTITTIPTELTIKEEQIRA